MKTSKKNGLTRIGEVLIGLEGVLGILIGVVLFLGSILLGLGISDFMGGLVGGFLLSFGVFIGLFFIIEGYGLFTYKSWARIIYTISSILAAISGGIGIISLVMLYFLWFDETIKERFDSKK